MLKPGFRPGPRANGNPDSKPPGPLSPTSVGATAVLSSPRATGAVAAREPPRRRCSSRGGSRPPRTKRPGGRGRRRGSGAGGGASIPSTSPAGAGSGGVGLPRGDLLPALASAAATSGRVLTGAVVGLPARGATTAASPGPSAAAPTASSGPEATVPAGPSAPATAAALSFGPSAAAARPAQLCGNPLSSGQPSPRSTIATPAATSRASGRSCGAGARLLPNPNRDRQVSVFGRRRGAVAAGAAVPSAVRGPGLGLRPAAAPSSATRGRRHAHSPTIVPAGTGDTKSGRAPGAAGTPPRAPVRVQEWHVRGACCTAASSAPSPAAQPARAVRGPGPTLSSPNVGFQSDFGPRMQLEPPGQPGPTRRYQPTESSRAPAAHLQHFSSILYHLPSRIRSPASSPAGCASPQVLVARTRSRASHRKAR